MATKHTESSDRQSVADMAAAVHEEAARLAESGGRPATAARYRGFAARVRETLRELDGRPGRKPA